jgi:hypothetical protein
LRGLAILADTLASEPVDCTSKEVSQMLFEWVLMWYEDSCLTYFVLAIWGQGWHMEDL